MNKILGKHAVSRVAKDGIPRNRRVVLPDDQFDQAAVQSPFRFDHIGDGAVQRAATAGIRGGVAGTRAMAMNLPAGLRLLA